MISFTGTEWDVLCHALAVERDESLPLRPRAVDEPAVASLIARGFLRHPPGGSPFVMLTESGRSTVRRLTGDA